MRTRSLGSALVFGVLLASVALGLAAARSSVASEQGTAQHSSAMSFDSSSPTGDPAVARMDRRGSVDRALKQRDTLVAVGLAIVALAALARRASVIGFARERTGQAAPSPFCSRAPPALHALSA